MSMKIFLKDDRSSKYQIDNDKNEQRNWKLKCTFFADRRADEEEDDEAESFRELKGAGGGGGWNVGRLSWGANWYWTGIGLNVLLLEKKR